MTKSKDRVLKELEEFRDNMHKKTYLRKVAGSDDLMSTLVFAIGIAGHTFYNGNRDTVDEFHHVLYRICSRLLTRTFRDNYPRKDEKKISQKFIELCVIKNHYWRQFQRREDEYERKQIHERMEDMCRIRKKGR
jgi:hypothetical protein